MIAKCLAILAVVAQINAYGCNTNYASPVLAVGSSRLVGSGLVGSSGVVGSGLVGSTGVVGSGLVGSSGVAATSVSGATGNTAATTRNIVAKGKYPVALSNTGPVPDNRVPVTTAHVRTPVQEKPTVRLSANIPAPRTVAHSCTCYKQILRPRVHDQYITVPTVQRYIETTHTPVIENIQYEAVPINAPEVATGGVVGSGVVGSGLVGSGIVGSGLIGSGVVGSGLVGSGLVGSGLVGSTGVVGSTLVGSVPVSVQSVSVPSVQTVQSFPVSSVQSVPVSSIGTTSGVCQGSQGLYY